MGKSTETDDDRIWNEALDWLLLMQARPEDQRLKAAFDAWRAANDAHAAAFAEATHVWLLTGQTGLLGTPEASPDASGPEPFASWHEGIFFSPLPRWERARERVHSETQHPLSRTLSRQGREDRKVKTRSRHTTRVIATCGISALAACLAFFFLPAVLLRLTADYATNIGETRLVTLDDGTQVYLNTDSALRISYTPEQRQVELLAGEAFFTVPPDPERAFLVRADRGTVRVLGTAFQVRLDQPSLSIAVQSGVVDVSLDPPAVMERRALRKGQALRLDLTTGTAEPRQATPDRIAAWRDGRLIVDRWTVGEAVNEIARYHRGVIVLTDAALARQPISGVYDLQDPVAAVKAVVHPYAATVWEITPYVLIVSAR